MSVVDGSGGATGSGQRIDLRQVLRRYIHIYTCSSILHSGILCIATCTNVHHVYYMNCTLMIHEYYDSILGSFILVLHRHVHCSTSLFAYTGSGRTLIQLPAMPLISTSTMPTPTPTYTSYQSCTPTLKPPSSTPLARCLRAVWRAAIRRWSGTN